MKVRFIVTFAWWLTSCHVSVRRGFVDPRSTGISRMGRFPTRSRARTTARPAAHAAA
jgi:hypothetical protein